MARPKADNWLTEKQIEGMRKSRILKNVWYGGFIWNSLLRVYVINVITRCSDASKLTILLLAELSELLPAFSAERLKFWNFEIVYILSYWKAFGPNSEWY